jgi:hypothetical protein
MKVLTDRVSLHHKFLQSYLLLAQYIVIKLYSDLIRRTYVHVMIGVYDALTNNLRIQFGHET